MPGYDQHAKADLTRRLKEQAERLGFTASGVAQAERLDDEARRLERWLLEGRHAGMDWMERHFDKRTDPTKLVEGAESVVSVVHSYHQPDADPPEDPAKGKISRYAWGDDYHDVLKEKLYLLFEWLDAEVNGAGGRVFVDSAPVMDKAWAARSGLGWQGKHSNLLSREYGSWFFIGEMIVDVPLATDDPVQDFCGSCTRCLDACPTDAIYEPYAVDSERCISYQTIENRTPDVPDDLKPDLDNWIFGCDICQEVCPWNKFAQPTTEPRYQPRDGTTDTPLDEWAELDLETFRKRFDDSPVTRARYEGFQRNVRIARENQRGRKAKRKAENRG